MFKVGDEVVHTLYSHWGTGKVIRINNYTPFEIQVNWEKETPSEYRKNGTQNSQRVLIRKLSKLEKAMQ